MWQVETFRQFAMVFNLCVTSYSFSLFNPKAKTSIQSFSFRKLFSWHGVGSFLGLDEAASVGDSVTMIWGVMFLFTINYYTTTSIPTMLLCSTAMCWLEKLQTLLKRETNVLKLSLRPVHCNFSTQCFIMLCFFFAFRSWSHVHLTCLLLLLTFVHVYIPLYVLNWKFARALVTWHTCVRYLHVTPSRLKRSTSSQWYVGSQGFNQ